jgi:hypothetical protein
MRHSKTSQLVFPVIFMALFVVFIAVPLHAQQATKISGTVTGQYVKGEQFSLGDSPDHTIALSQWTGANKNTGDNSYMDGSSISEVSFYDLVKGNGNAQGYITFASGADTTMAHWEGKMITTSAKDQAGPKHEGKWTFIYGTGKYKGISGSGTYEGNSTSDKSFEVNWKGEYTLGK